MAAAWQVLRWVMFGLFALAAVACLLMTPASGGLTLPLALVFSGLSIGLIHRDYASGPSGVARWLLFIGLALLALEVIALIVL